MQDLSGEFGDTAGHLLRLLRLFRKGGINKGGRGKTNRSYPGVQPVKLKEVCFIFGVYFVLFKRSASALYY